MNSKTTILCAGFAIAIVGAIFLLKSGATRQMGKLQAASSIATSPSQGQRVAAASVGNESVAPNAPYYAKTFRLILKGHANTLHLSDAQIAYVQECYTKFVEDRLALEASIAKVTSVTPEKTEIEIPSYVDAGKALEADFYLSVEDQLGVALTDSFREQYGRMIDADNYLVGQEPQELTVTVMKPDGLYEVHHTIISSIFDRTLVDQFAPDNPGAYKALLPLFPKI
jgi:hypothetical protein